ncbi:hypothetical protein NX784_13780 [Massilia pinisoli]|uniref:DUF1145 domain-containing protein n=1 Tax=Massilia pinisoli TaxID=1772194 RepID=A0ABT1ZRX7_9BURK|nr:hypothetical protein [Massilia pinisoli]MCS0582666.1 hypothetical protein [Massilia pinisoli]
MRALKLACLALYGLALAALAGIWTGTGAVAVRDLALVILAAHAVETGVAFRFVRRYRGALALSVLLALLFGLLHIVPLARQSART